MPAMVTEVAQNSSHAAARRRRLSLRGIAYWACTAIVAWEMVAGSMWDLLRIEFVRGVFDHLRYPHYLLLIIGVWKLPCAVTLFVPRFPRLKEWAYAGAIFNYTGAAASHFLVGDGPNKWMVPFIFAVITLASGCVDRSARRDRGVPGRCALDAAEGTAAAVTSMMKGIGASLGFRIVKHQSSHSRRPIGGDHDAPFRAPK